MIENTLIRPIEPHELPILEEFFYWSIFTPIGYKLPPRNVIFDPRMIIYLENFGQEPGDYCLVAERSDKIIGAAWSRILATDGKSGFGNIDSRTPELVISVLSEYRGNGVGTKLLTALLGVLAENGYHRLSLSAQKENTTALGLYRKIGFEVVGENEEEYIMLKSF